MRKNDPLGAPEFQENFKLDMLARASLFDNNVIENRCDKRRIHAVFKGQLLFQCSPNRLHLCFRGFALFFFLSNLGKLQFQPLHLVVEAVISFFELLPY